jgi:hypothetical protein
MIPNRSYWSRVSYSGRKCAHWHSLSDRRSDGGVETMRPAMTEVLACINIEGLPANGIGMSMGGDGPGCCSVGKSKGVSAC